MTKFLTEDQLAPADRQVSGIGDGSKEQGHASVQVPTRGPQGETIQPMLPFEIQVVISQIGDIFVRMCEMRKQFESALDNPSMDNIRRTVLEDIIDNKIDKVNHTLLAIPIMLNKMHSKKGNSIKTGNAKNN